MARRRRKYGDYGPCQECIRGGKTTWVTFWLNGLRMRLCARCVAQYRAVILKEGKGAN